jgi:hypothetical protein
MFLPFFLPFLDNQNKDPSSPNSRPRRFVFGNEYAETVLSLNLNNRRPLMLLSSIPRCYHPNEVLDYNAGTAAYEGQFPFLTESMAPVGTIIKGFSCIGDIGWRV